MEEGPSSNPAGLAESAFRFLRELGFEVTRSTDGRRESLVQFEADGVRVSIVVESFAVTVSVGRVRADGKMTENYGLPLLVADACPEQESRLRAAEQPTAERLRTAAELLELAGADVLVGDFSRGHRLKRLRAERTRCANKEEWGTSTGETPRFDERPDLAVLFADAANDGIREARSYQAFWDWDYTLAEVADHLSVSESDVQAMLDRWEGL
ncbi:hypothetical protein DRQ53_15970 [bacterium]|nr:MAG: hypothetical protein DRQ53_15970 [bacterium]